MAILGSGGSGVGNNVISFQQSASWTPAYNMEAIVYVIGGGGSGGCCGNGNNNGSVEVTGGGAGGTAVSKLTLLSSVTYTVTIGSGGAHVAKGTGSPDFIDGNAGGNSSLAGSNITTMTGNGGAAGEGSTSGGAASGGSASGGNMANLTGGASAAVTASSKAASGGGGVNLFGFVKASGQAAQSKGEGGTAYPNQYMATDGDNNGLYYYGTAYYKNTPAAFDSLASAEATTSPIPYQVGSYYRPYYSRGQKPVGSTYKASTDLNQVNLSDNKYADPAVPFVGGAGLYGNVSATVHAQAGCCGSGGGAAFNNYTNKNGASGGGGGGLILILPIEIG